MRLFVGLGNPGKDYAQHRHNVGFMAVTAIGARHGFGPWKKAFQGEIAAGSIGTEKIILLKPLTYMNESGRSVGDAMRFYKLTPDDVVVFYDELDLAPGKMRVRMGGGTGGHNGIRSLGAHIGPDFWRVRIGIGHPGHKDKVTGYVLGNFAKTDTWVEPLLEAMTTEAISLAAGEDKKFMNDVALRLTPPRVNSPVPKTEKPQKMEEDQA